MTRKTQNKHRLKTLNEILTKEEQKILVLYYYDDLTQKELAAKFEILQQTISLKLMKIEKKLNDASLPVPKKYYNPTAGENKEIRLPDHLLNHMYKDQYSVVRLGATDKTDPYSDWKKLLKR